MSISRSTKVRSRNFSRSTLADAEFVVVIGPPSMHEALNACYWCNHTAFRRAGQGAIIADKSVCVRDSLMAGDQDLAAKAIGRIADILQIDTAKIVRIARSDAEGFD